MSMMIIFIKSYHPCLKAGKCRDYQGDFLQYELPEGKEYKVFANIPFNITAEIIHKITEKNRAPQDAYLVIQKEAAWKYIGYPYYKESLRSLLLKPYFEFRILHSFQKQISGQYRM